MRALSEMLKVNKTLKHLRVYTKNLSDDDVQALICALRENSTLESLGLHHDIRLLGRVYAI